MTVSLDTSSSPTLHDPASLLDYFTELADPRASRGESTDSTRSSSYPSAPSPAVPIAGKRSPATPTPRGQKAGRGQTTRAESGTKGRKRDGYDKGQKAGRVRY